MEGGTFSRCPRKVSYERIRALTVRPKQWLVRPSQWLENRGKRPVLWGRGSAGKD